MGPRPRPRLGPQHLPGARGMHPHEGVRSTGFERRPQPLMLPGGKRRPREGRRLVQSHTACWRLSSPAFLPPRRRDGQLPPASAPWGARELPARAQAQQEGDPWAGIPGSELHFPWEVGWVWREPSISMVTRSVVEGRVPAGSWWGVGDARSSQTSGTGTSPRCGPCPQHPALSPTTGPSQGERRPPTRGGLGPVPPRHEIWSRPNRTITLIAVCTKFTVITSLTGGGA